jgi:ABC-type lipoprotein release transport system permease subunit
VSAHEPAAYLAAAGVLLATGAAAAVLPARRAWRVDPLSVLKDER